MMDVDEQVDWKLPTDHDKMCVKKNDGELKLIQAGLQPDEMLNAEYALVEPSPTFTQTRRPV